MRNLITAAFGAVSLFSVTASDAFADIACNREGDCWHVRERREFRPEHGVTVHPDNWRWEEREAERHRWREHEGHGYWREGAWIEIR
jgi:hypothetical protein